MLYVYHIIIIHWQIYVHNVPCKYLYACMYVKCIHNMMYDALVLMYVHMGVYYIVLNDMETSLPTAMIIIPASPLPIALVATTENV